MKRSILVTLLLLSGVISALANLQTRSHKGQESKTLGQKSSDSTWGRGDFRGLAVGRSTGADMRRVLGSPNTTASPDGESEGDLNAELLNYYNGVGDVLGVLTVGVNEKSGLITSIVFVPDDMTLKDVTARYGKNFQVVHYDFDECLGDEESAPIYESPTGPLVSVEYRSLGIVVAMNSNHKVNDIRYVDGPIGNKTSQCKNTKTGSKP